MLRKTCPKPAHNWASYFNGQKFISWSHVDKRYTRFHTFVPHCGFGRKIQILPDVGTSCFGELLILSSKAIKGVAGGGFRAPPALTVASLLKSRIWSNSGCASSGACFRLTGTTGSRSKRLLSFFLQKVKKKFRINSGL